jgi:hypothetical protein
VQSEAALAGALLGPRRSDFESNPTDIIEIYMNPPQHSAVFCIDEKTAIQALDQLDSVLPFSLGRAERHGFEYFRHGVPSLYAALDIAGNYMPKSLAGC